MRFDYFNEFSLVGGWWRDHVYDEVVFEGMMNI